MATPVELPHRALVLEQMTFGEAYECIILSSSLEDHTAFHLSPVKRQTVGSFCDASGQDESLGGRCLCLPEVWSESRWRRLGSGLCGVQLLRCSLSGPGTCLLLSSSGADFTSCWVQSLHHLCSQPQPGHELLIIPLLGFTPP